MSHYIIYDRRFIQTSRGIIPMMLYGDSCWTTTVTDSMGRKREEILKHWSTYNRDLLELPIEKIQRWAQDNFSDRPEDETSLRWKGSFLLRGQILKWFTQGCQNARSIEEYLASNRDQSLLCKVVVWHGDVRSESPCEFCRTTEQLERWIDAAKEKVAAEKEDDPKADCFISISFTIDKPLRTYKGTQGAVVAKDGKAFVRSFIKGKELSFTLDPAEAVVFDSAEAAMAALGDCWNLRFVKAATQMRSKNYALRVTEGILAGRYILKHTRTCVRGTAIAEDARRFAHRADAIRYLKRLREDYPKSRTGTVVLVNIRSGKEEILDI